MKLNFNRRGVKLFFLTFAIEGRRKILSRLIEGESRPILTEAGAAVKSLWRHVHAFYPYLGTSDYVIMPDHVHLLLVVDFDRSPRFNPLVFVHWFKRSTALWIDAILGGSAPAPQSDSKTPSPLPEFIAAPEDFVYPRSPEPIASGVRGAIPNVAFEWERAFWLDLAMGPRQLKAIRHYIRLNPARALWKSKNADCFIRRPVKTAKLVDELGPLPEVFYAVGDVTILGSPFLRHVRLTMKKTAEEHRAEIDEIVEASRRGVVPVSGFISAGEKELLRRLKAEANVRFVRTLPFALTPRYDPSAEDSRELAAHRLVIISTLAEVDSISPLEMRESRAAAHSFRENCLAMNDLAAALCQRSIY